jgi:hypothetical protein
MLCLEFFYSQSQVVFPFFGFRCGPWAEGRVTYRYKVGRYRYQYQYRYMIQKATKQAKLNERLKHARTHSDAQEYQSSNQELTSF